jgi:hypothetical protein
LIVEFVAMSKTRKSKLKLRKRVNIPAVIAPALVPTVSVINALVQNTIRTTSSTKEEVMESQRYIVKSKVVVSARVLGGTLDAKVGVQDLDQVPSNISRFKVPDAVLSALVAATGGRSATATTVTTVLEVAALQP